MAKLMGDTDFATAMSTRAALSSKNYERICYNPKFGYYIADVTVATSSHSYGPGCFVDQICCAGLSSACGFGYMFNAEHEHSARLAILKYNKVVAPPFKDLQGHFYDGDSGVTVCTYPNGKIGGGMQYTNLVSAGFTSPVIAGFLLDRDTESAETVAGFIRNRQSGKNASPWNEPECNLLYSRSMAHWNLFDQACGLVYDCTKHYLAYDPRYTPNNFKAFFCAENSWGNFTQTGDAGMKNGTATLTVIRGSLQLSTLQLVFDSTGATASVDGKVYPQTAFSKGAITFSPMLTLAQGSVLTITYKSAFDTINVCCPPQGDLRRRAVASQGCCPSPSPGCEKISSTNCCPEKTQTQPSLAVVTEIETSNAYVNYVKLVMLCALIFMVGIALGIYGPQYLNQE